MGMLWMRSDVEKLTGLTKRSVQELCGRKRRSHDVGFWRPVESRPGYSRFDEADAVVLHLAGRLHAAGFTLAEMENAIRAALVRRARSDDSEVSDEADEFGSLLASKAAVLRAERERIEAREQALKEIRAEAASSQDAGECRLASLDRGFLHGAFRRGIEAAVKRKSLPEPCAQRALDAFDEAWNVRVVNSSDMQTGESAQEAETVRGAGASGASGSTGEFDAEGLAALLDSAFEHMSRWGVSLEPAAHALVSIVRGEGSVARRQRARADA